MNSNLYAVAAAVAVDVAVNFSIYFVYSCEIIAISTANDNNYNRIFHKPGNNNESELPVV